MAPKREWKLRPAEAATPPPPQKMSSPGSAEKHKRELVEAAQEEDIAGVAKKSRSVERSVEPETPEGSKGSKRDLTSEVQEDIAGVAKKSRSEETQLVDNTPKTPEPVPLQSEPQEPDDTSEPHTPQVLRALLDSPDRGATHCAGDTGQVVETGQILDARAIAQEKKDPKIAQEKTQN